ncbi:MAG: Mut7-C RNAse domain-containing protein [Acidobacteria bacterium]|nr:Mut7-C RNAse domain-containing protein [Acidobacteriota bacterium]
MGNSETRRKAAVVRRERIRAKTAAAMRGAGERPRFVADVMLGKLAKWLRIAGFDVLYSNRYSDDALIALSNKEGRILLSLDSRLLVRKSVKNFIFLESGNLEDQIKRILESTHSGMFPSPLSRCLSCNEILADVPRESVRDRVPAYVFRTQSHFKRCPQCGKIFWSGTHSRKALKTLDKILADVRSREHDPAGASFLQPTRRA